ncbi:hypothetical protein [Micromonospora maritima]|uniref:hypothetical protein n=1 Tax=Micromonospora maritima TaxID=986711 RepID=UPI00157D26F2|nr:hypothetical protein [Micromonospora maritima]
MLARRAALAAIAALTTVHIAYTVVALSNYSFRIGLVTHDGAGFVAELLNHLVPLRELLPAMVGLLLLTLLVTVAAVGTWAVRRPARTAEGRSPAPGWTAAVAAVLLNPLAVVWYGFTSSNGADHMRTVQPVTVLLMVAACAVTVVALVNLARTVRRPATTVPGSRRPDPARRW